MSAGALGFRETNPGTGFCRYGDEPYAQPDGRSRGGVWYIERSTIEAWCDADTPSPLEPFVRWPRLDLMAKGIWLCGASDVTFLQELTPLPYSSRSYCLQELP